MTNPLAVVPRKVRQYVYVAYLVVGVALGALEQAGVTSVADVQLATIVDVYRYLGTAVAALAVSNVSYTGRSRGEPRVVVELNGQQVQAALIKHQRERGESD